MIINLICGDNIFTSNDKQWDKIRGIISLASHEYIIEYKNNMIQNDIMPNEEDSDINVDSKNDESKEYNYYQKTLYEKSVDKEVLLKTIDEIMNEIQNMGYCINPMQSKNIDINENKCLLKLYKKYLNLLTILGLSGIYSLNINTNNNNINSFYSIGNSYDIANSIDLVLSSINNEYIEYLIFEVLMLFNYSVKNNLIISITKDKNQNNVDVNQNEHKNPLIKIIHKKGSLSSKLKKIQKTTK